MIGNRRRSREAALQILYQDEFHEAGTRAIAEAYYWQRAEDLPVDKGEIREFARRLLEGVREHHDQVDDLIRAVARNWKIERMSRVDRNILRVATFELLFVDDIPPKVSINEAIEIAKAYGAEDSSAFINGILDKISRQLAERRQAAAGEDPGTTEIP